METGACRYGPKCQFAHGEHELRPVLRHPKYKTEICRNYEETGTCPYGSRCRFVHYHRGSSGSSSGSSASASTSSEASIDIDLDEASSQLGDLQISAVVDGDAIAPVVAVVEAKPTPAAKGSRLPFFQKLRRIPSGEKEKERSEKK